MKLSRNRRIGECKYLVVDGSRPSVRALQRVAVAGRGVLVEELPQGDHSLEFLAPIIERLERLIVTYRGVVDLSILESAHSLRELDAWCQPLHGPDLAAVPLDSFAGMAQDAWLALLDRPGLKRLTLENADMSWIRGSQGIEAIELTGLRGASEVPRAVRDMESLRALRLHGGKSIDVANLSGHAALEIVEIASTKLLSGAAALAHLPSLKQLHLEDVEKIDDLTWAGPGVQTRRLVVIGNSPWIADARARTLPNPRGWSFPPWSD